MDGPELAIKTQTSNNLDFRKPEMETFTRIKVDCDAAVPYRIDLFQSEINICLCT